MSSDAPFGEPSGDGHAPTLPPPAPPALQPGQGQRPEAPLAEGSFTIAVVEDDEDIRDNVCSFLGKAGLLVWGAASAEDFYVRLLHQQADLVVVDLGLPGEDGLSLVRRLSERRVPVIVKTARGQLSDRIAGLDAGALQYFVKPADLNELVAGIRSQLRHLVADRAASEVPPWRLDAVDGLLLAPNQCSVRLTSREQELLTCLMAAPGTLVGKADLVVAMGHGDAEGGFHRIEALLSRLRRKTLEATGLSLPVRAIFGRGLVFVG